MGKTKMSRGGSYLNFSKSGTKSKSRSASGMPSGVDTRMSKSGASKSRSKSGMSRSASARSKSKSKSGMAASKSGFRTSGGSKLMVPSKSGYKSQSRSGASRSKIRNEPEPGCFPGSFPGIQIRMETHWKHGTD